MKTHSNRRFITTTLATLCAALSAQAVVVFQDDFESGLVQWEGKPIGGVHSGFVAADPAASGHGGVLAFGAVKAGGDIFTAAVFAPGKYELSFDYLGLPSNAGGYLGTMNYVAAWVSLGMASPLWGDHWMAGNPFTANPVIENGQWNHYTIEFEKLSSFKLMLEDFKGSPGDAFFDNIQLTNKSVPDAGSSALLLGISGMTLLAARRSGRKAE